MMLAFAMFLKHRTSGKLAFCHQMLRKALQAKIALQSFLAPALKRYSPYVFTKRRIHEEQVK